MLYLAAVAIVFAVNLMPVLGPPTWAVLILLMLNWHLNAATLVILGAIGAGGGRYVLALASRALRHKVGERRRQNLRAAQEALTGHKLGAVAGIGLFALSPLPSAQLFEAAGILELPLVPLTTAFFAGRIVSYSIYVSSASLAAKHYGSVISSALTSPTGIALQVAMLVALVLLAEVDWRSVITRLRTRRPH
ncbi:MAG TPA: hypothetical protein VN108_01740 [Marmoricola sp.]|nr:hypothetical protein [Marmoricola sp.]